MGQNFHFGGGAAASTMHPVVLVLALLASLAVLVLPRKYGLAPIMFIAFLTPFGEQLYIEGFHLYTIQIVILAGALRLAWVKASGRAIFDKGLSPIDKTFFLWAFSRALTFVLLYKSGGAIVSQLSFSLDAYGGYVLFRYFVQDRDDVVRTIKTMSVIAAILAPCMLFEHITRFNVFNYISTTPIVPWLRNGTFRAQGPFTENSITAGCFGAVLIALFFWLWKSRRGKFTGVVGMIASTVIVVVSVAGTAAMAYLGTILALSLWPLRNRMRTIRWGLVLAVICLDLMMKAPVWFVIARVDIVGGHGWDRAELLDQTVRHFPDWWLVGTKERAQWGTATWDACNQFVEEATTGGLLSLILFVTLIKRGFSLIGYARREANGKKDPEAEWFYWCVGVALFANVMAFTGVDYMDMMQDWWYVYLAIISAATVSVWAKAATEEDVRVEVLQPHLAPFPLPALGLHRRGWQK